MKPTKNSSMMGQYLMRFTGTDTKKVRVIPGFHLTLGITVAMLSILILIPLASVMVYSLRMDPKDFWSVISDSNVLWAFATSIVFSLIAAQGGQRHIVPDAQ